MFNRVRRFIKNITFNSGLNREKFINNKKKLIQNVNKNVNKNNMIIVRKMSTYSKPFGNGNNNNNNNNMFYMFLAASAVYISQGFYNKK